MNENEATETRFRTELTRETGIYRCVACHQSLNASPDEDCLTCSGCNASYTIRHNILNTLTNPHPEVIKELQGTAVEAGRDPGEWESIQIQHVDAVRSFDARLEATADDPNQYFQQTKLNFEQAVEYLVEVSPTRVLEIGSEVDYHFLDYFRKRNARCHAVNLYFERQEPDPFLDWPEKTLADMNELPFQDGTFDLVLFSATLHHSPDLEATMREVARVLSVGGIALVLNEQIGGLLKRTDRYDHRSEMIHETYHSFRKYHNGFVRAGFHADYLFSRYFDEKLSTAEIHSGRRFARFGKAVAFLWKVPLFRRFARGPLLRPAHVLFGFPLNAVLRKLS